MAVGHRQWRWTTGLAAPLVLTVVAAMIGIIAFVLWSTQASDERSLQRQAKLVAHVIAAQIKTVAREQESVVFWDDAVLNTSASFDKVWISDNLGEWMYEYFGHDRNYVLDGRNQPIYAMHHGMEADPAVFEKGADAYGPLVAHMRAMLGSGAIARFSGGLIREYPRVVDLAVVDGLPAIISIMPITTETGEHLMPAGHEYLHVSVKFLDTALANELSDQYMLSRGAFTLTSLGNPDRGTYPITNNAGRFVTFFEWQLDRPGQRALMQTLPALGIASITGLGLVIFLLVQLRKAARALEAERQETYRRANHDSLTGLPNRALFDATLEEALIRSHSVLHAGLTAVGVLMIDLDRFKYVNDTRGHQVGDELIQAVAKRLELLVGPDDVIGRIGGDEFAILVERVPDNHHLRVLARRIIDAISTPFSIQGGDVFVGASVGIAVAEGKHNKDQRSEMMRKGDIALYEAKAGGRNRAEFYRPEMDAVLQQRNTIEAELREALRQDGALHLAFQPLISSDGHRVIGAEALARWTHKTMGDISPARFIPVAESTGLIEPLGELILRRACEMGARWPGRTIAINISPAQLRNPNFPTYIFEVLEETGMRACDLEVEITEGILLEDAHMSNETLRRFRMAGIKVALDDFGTGYSSLSYLRRYAVDRIKIDRSFVSQLDDGAVSVAIVQAMVTLAHAMDIEVTAEGVENAAQVEVLTQIGCDTFQGYHFSKPVSPEQIEAVFAGSFDAAQVA